MRDLNFTPPDTRNTESNLSDHTTTALPPMPYKIDAVGLSDIGLVRQNNEDVWASVPEIGLYILADGMGGHQAGEVAARETVSGLCRVLKRKLGRSRHYTLDELQDLLKRAIMYVNAQVFKMSRASEELRGMGTTLCCLLFHADGVAIGHVGDSRIYRMRGGHFEQMTKDHSLLREMVDQGQVDMQNATDFLYKNIITKAIGTEPKVEPTVTAIHVHHHDMFLMCTDGLSDMLLSKQIGSIVRNNPILHIAAETLVSEAIDEGGRDNITVVLIKILGADGDKDLSRQ